MGLNQKQWEFSHAVGLLILHIFSRSYKMSHGDAYSKPEYKSHSKNSKHYDRLAIDINLFDRDGNYITNTEGHRYFGEYWKELGGTWGGDFKDKNGNSDGNHYSWGE